MTTTPADLNGNGDGYGDHAAAGYAAAPYEDGPAGLIEVKGEDRRRLANFSARITADTIWDDGSGEARRTFTIDAQIGERGQRLDVPASAFGQMAWVAELGAGAYLEPGPGVREKARHAIQMLSAPGLRPRQVFTHTGWREIDGMSVYLHAGGAIGPDGPVEGVEVSLPNELELMRLPRPPAGEDLREAVRRALELLDLAPDEVIVPLLGATYRAPLEDTNMAMHEVGATGSYKTELSALCQQHYGPGFDALHLPGSWSSTANFTELLAHAAKDALLVVDDFAPGGSKNDVSRAHSGADRLLRAQGNHAGRGRLRSDTTTRPPKPPRGLILSTGEDTPRGQSLRARLVVLEVRRGDVDLEALTRAQELAAAGVYAGAMAAYISWLANRPRLERKAAGARRERQLRDILSGIGHARVPDNLAKLAAGLETFLAFAMDVGAIPDADTLWQRCWGALLRVAGSQAEHQAAADPAARFLRLLSGAITSGRAHVADAANDREPDKPASWGWRQDLSHRWLTPPGSSRIGWLDDGDVYLDREASYSAAQRAAEDAGQSLAIDQLELHRRLRDGGWLVVGEEKDGRLTVRRTLAGVKRRVLRLKAHTVLEPTAPMTTRPGLPGPRRPSLATQPTFAGGFAPSASPGVADPPGPQRDPSGPPVPVSPGRAGRPGPRNPGTHGQFRTPGPGSPGPVTRDGPGGSGTDVK